MDHGDHSFRGTPCAAKAWFAAARAQGFSVATTLITGRVTDWTMSGRVTGVTEVVDVAGDDDRDS